MEPIFWNINLADIYRFPLFVWLSIRSEDKRFTCRRCQKSILWFSFWLWCSIYLNKSSINHHVEVVRTIACYVKRVFPTKVICWSLDSNRLAGKSFPLGKSIITWVFLLFCLIIVIYCIWFKRFYRFGVNKSGITNDGRAIDLLTLNLSQGHRKRYFDSFCIKMRLRSPIHRI